MGVKLGLSHIKGRTQIVDVCKWVAEENIWT